MPKKPKTPQEPKPQLTEWQKRNLEFLKKKAEREAERKRLEEEMIQAQAFEAAEGQEDQEEKLEEGGQKDSQKDSAETQAPSAWYQKWPSLKAKKVEFKKSPQSFLRWLGLAILLIFFSLTLLISIFFISPYSKQKVIEVTGLTNAKEADIRQSAGIEDTDYWIDLVLKPQPHERAIVKANTWVKSAKLVHSFPNRFQLKIEEFPIVAYGAGQEGYHPILEDGSLITEQTLTEIPQGSLVINLTKTEDMKTFLEQLTKLDSELVASIQTIDLVPSKATSDLLLVTMRDGNQIRVPLSELEVKLPYYPKLAKNLMAPAIVDMEVGIYTTSAYVETLLAESKAERAQEKAELAELEQAQEEASEAQEGETEEVTEDTSSSEGE